MLSVIYNNIEIVYQKIGDYQQVLKYIEKAFNIDTTCLPVNHVDLALTYTNMCLILTHLKLYDKAILYYQQAIEIRNKHFPSQYPSFIQFKLNAFEEALKSSKKSLNINLELFGTKHANSMSAYIQFWTYTTRTGRFKEALQGAIKTLEISIEIFGMSHSISCKCQNTIEFICSKMSDET
ncbi:unnamed protein product [Adineta ricciae]|uniref:Uncharacterized protein n=1 Tax=Adineta ricciae TaxID=249248 RepID=A0A815W7G1_ADIRI|nr:unnamed protein product [Adineta ricciae]CAF1602286.1 unnamed protein product [Adineta ricciae]